jgi:hypothetical protein
VLTLRGVPPKIDRKVRGLPRAWPYSCASRLVVDAPDGASERTSACLSPAPRRAALHHYTAQACRVPDG